jgi:hypothetical protein|tara:strand:- start:39 stop:599 length:561 start_codon:yes stop_codon:yes gene_type:complete
MSKIQVDTIDTRSGTSTLTLGSTNASTVALGSGDVQSNFNTPAFKVLLDSTQTIATSTDTVIAYDTELYDTDSAVSSGVFTVPTGKGGKYFFAMNGGFNTSSDIDTVSITISKNEQKTISSNAGDAVNIEYHHDGTTVSQYIQSLSTTMDLDAGDTVRVYYWHNYGSNRDTATDGRAVFSGFRIGT